MTKFVENVNEYMNEWKIKQSYLCTLTGIEKNKMSRILTGTQDVSGSDMEKIAKGLGKNVEYFLFDTFSVPKRPKYSPNKIECVVGNATQKQLEIGDKLITFLENIDEVLGAQIRFCNAVGDDE